MATLARHSASTRSAGFVCCLLAANLALASCDEAGPGSLHVPCGDEERANWEAIQTLLQEEAVALSSRLPFGFLKADQAKLGALHEQLGGVGLPRTVLASTELPNSWNFCSFGLITSRLFMDMTAITGDRFFAVIVTTLRSVLATPWLEILASGWPLFSGLAILAKWGTPHSVILRGEAAFDAARWSELSDFIRGFSGSSICDAVEAGAPQAVRSRISTVWRQRRGLEDDGEIEMFERALAGLEGSHVRASPHCRWTEHAGRFLGGAIADEQEEEQSGKVFSNLIESLWACSEHRDCMGVTAARSSEALAVTLMRGDPFLEVSPIGETSFVRWCEPTVCFHSRVAGLLAVAVRRLDSMDLNDFAPELVLEAQGLIRDWVKHQLAAVESEVDLWLTEWPIFEILGRLQQRYEASKPPKEREEAPASSSWPTALRKALGFTDDAWRLATEEMANLSPDLLPLGLREEVHCTSGKTCLGELHARMQLLLFSTGALPLRDPLGNKIEDSLGPVQLEHRRALTGANQAINSWIPRPSEDGDGLSASELLDRLQPAEHPLQVDRRQLAHFVLSVRDVIVERAPLRRCLEWDEPWISINVFRRACKYMDLFSYSEPNPEDPSMGQPGRREYQLGTRHYWGDLEHPKGAGLDSETFDLVICPFVFEHISRPFVAMRTLVESMRPGAFMIWAAPFITQYHGSPHDYFRYTIGGAKSLAESAGLRVITTYAPGDLSLAMGIMNGMLLPYWTDDQILREEPLRKKENSPRHPMNVFALFQKPLADDAEPGS